MVLQDHNLRNLNFGNIKRKSSKYEHLNGYSSPGEIVNLGGEKAKSAKGGENLATRESVKTGREQWPCSNGPDRRGSHKKKD